MSRTIAGAGLALALALAPVLPAAASPSSPAASSTGSGEFHFVGAGLYGYAKSRIRTGSGASVRIDPGWSWRGYGRDKVRLHVDLQRDAGSGWRTISTAQHAVGDVAVTAPTFRTAAKQRTVRYRLHSRAYTSDVSTVQNDAWSDPVTVVYENQRLYTGLAKRMYDFMAPYCPQTSVRVVPLIGGDDHIAGQASGAGQSVLIRASDASMPPAYQRAVALHECGHVHQWLNYGGTPKGADLAAAAEKRYFVNDDPPKGVGWPYSAAGPGFSALEHAADCGSIAVDPQGYLGYGGWCSPSERKRGRWLLEGRRYDGRPGIPS